MRTGLIVASALLTVTTSIAAAAADGSARGVGVYGSFFTQAAPKQNQNPPVTSNRPAPVVASKPAVVCGMTLLPARPVDSRMKIPTPDAKRFPMQTFEPQVCKR